MVTYGYHLGMSKHDKTPPKEKELKPAEAKEQMDRFFHDLEERLKKEPPGALDEAAKKVMDFVHGKIGWTELLNMTPEAMMKIAETGYAEFKMGHYQEAERCFKVLTYLDWDNSYYHSMLGSILQKQKRFGEAIGEYTQALEKNPNDLVSLTNRGEIFFQHGWLDQAEADFNKAIALDPTQENKWANRAAVLNLQVMKARGDKKGEDPENSKKKKQKET